MPLKTPPKFYQLLLKTHRAAIFLSAAQSATIASLKTDALSALQSEAGKIKDVPAVNEEGDFEICRAVKEKGKNTVQYELLPLTGTVKSELSNWEALFLQFRDASGNLQPVEVVQPSLFDEDDVVEGGGSRALASSVPMDIESPDVMNKGKRKEPPE